MTKPSPQVTQLLVAWGNGDQAALEQLMPLVYQQLHRLARRHLGRERPGHTLQTTALVHEAYLRLIEERTAMAEPRPLLRRRRPDDAAHPVPRAVAEAAATTHFAAWEY